MPAATQTLCGRRPAAFASGLRTACEGLSQVPHVWLLHPGMHAASAAAVAPLCVPALRAVAGARAAGWLLAAVRPGHRVA